MQGYVFAAIDQRLHVSLQVPEDVEGQKADACDVDVPQGSRLCPPYLPNTNDVDADPLPHPFLRVN